LALAALALLGACSPKNNGTLLVVRVDTDLPVPAQLDKIEIQVVPERGAASTDAFTLTGRNGLPVTLGLNPKGDPDFSVEVTARGLRGSDLAVTQTASVHFVPGQAREFTMFLANDCVTAGACQAPMVCVRGPSCVAKNAVATLKPYVPGGEDAGAAGDAPVEAGGDRPGDVVAEAPADVVTPPDAPTAEARPNPGTWASVPGVPATITLSAIWPNSDRDVWVAGAMAAGVVLHYDGQTWNPSAIPPTTPALYGLWGSANGDVWAVGAAGTVLHLANNVWQSMKVPTMPLPTLTSIWGAKADDIWIAGSGGKIFHIDGTGTITPETSGVTAGLFAVGGSAVANGLSDVWAVGASGTILHRGSTGWAPVAQGTTQSILYGVWSDAPANVWVAGDKTVLHGGSAGGWKAVPGSVDVSLAIWGSAGDDLWTVGRPAAGGSTITRWDGVAFSNVTDAPAMPLQTVRGISSMSVWAAGANRAVYRFKSK
jgi:hypothetical protein